MITVRAVALVQLLTKVSCGSLACPAEPRFGAEGLRSEARLAGHRSLVP